MNKELVEKVIQDIRRLAGQGCWQDSFDDDSCVFDFSGSNVDDAYEGGYRSGETMLARDIIQSGLLDSLNENN